METTVFNAFANLIASLHKYNCELVYAYAADNSMEVIAILSPDVLANLIRNVHTASQAKQRTSREAHVEVLDVDIENNVFKVKITCKSK